MCAGLYSSRVLLDAVALQLEVDEFARMWQSREETADDGLGLRQAGVGGTVKHQLITTRVLHAPSFYCFQQNVKWNNSSLNTVQKLPIASNVSILWRLWTNWANVSDYCIDTMDYVSTPTVQILQSGALLHG